jgi:hypothetical protein
VAASLRASRPVGVAQPQTGVSNDPADDVGTSRPGSFRATRPGGKATEGHFDSRPRTQCHGGSDYRDPWPNILRDMGGYPDAALMMSRTTVPVIVPNPPMEAIVTPRSAIISSVMTTDNMRGSEGSSEVWLSTV